MRESAGCRVVRRARRWGMCRLRVRADTRGGRGMGMAPARNRTEGKRKGRRTKVPPLHKAKREEVGAQRERRARRAEWRWPMYNPCEFSGGFYATRFYLFAIRTAIFGGGVLGRRGGGGGFCGFLNTTKSGGCWLVGVVGGGGEG